MGTLRYGKVLSAHEVNQLLPHRCAVIDIENHRHNTCFVCARLDKHLDCRNCPKGGGIQRTWCHRFIKNMSVIKVREHRDDRYITRHYLSVRRVMLEVDPRTQCWNGRITQRRKFSYWFRHADQMMCSHITFRVKVPHTLKQKWTNRNMGEQYIAMYALYTRIL